MKVSELLDVKKNCRNCRWRREDNVAYDAWICANEFSPWYCEYIGDNDQCGVFEKEVTLNDYKRRCMGYSGGVPE